MNNFELHEAATELQDTSTHYNLAREVVTLREHIKELEKGQKQED